MKSTKNKKEIPEPIPQNEPKKQKDTLGLTINDKYDGLKMKNKQYHGQK